MLLAVNFYMLILFDSTFNNKHVIMLLCSRRHFPQVRFAAHLSPVKQQKDGVNETTNSKNYAYDKLYNRAFQITIE